MIPGTLGIRQISAICHLSSMLCTMVSPYKKKFYSSVDLRRLSHDKIHSPGPECHPWQEAQPDEGDESSTEEEEGCEERLL
jgi:hypothetical protein